MQGMYRAEDSSEELKLTFSYQHRRTKAEQQEHSWLNQAKFSTHIIQFRQIVCQKALVERIGGGVIRLLRQYLRLLFS
jgi:hypothetical protein